MVRRHLGLALALALSACSGDAPGPATPSQDAEPAGLSRGTIVEVAGDEVRIYREPDGRTVVNHVFPGHRLLATDNPTPVGDQTWIRVQYSADGFGWLRLDAEEDVVSEVEVECPEPSEGEALEVDDVVALSPIERMACFAGRELRLNPVTWRTLDSSDSPFGGEPDWLADEGTLHLYGRGGWEQEESLAAHVDPDNDPVLEDGGWGTITGRFGHPGSEACERGIDLRGMGIADKEDLIQELVEPTAAESVLWCQQQFVITGVEFMAAPPPLPLPRAEAAGGSWRMIPEAPLLPRTGHAAVWTGTELIVWGGQANAMAEGVHTFVLASDGAAYDPASEAWRPIAQAPLAGRALPHAAWTGNEMLVVGGHDENFAGLPDGAAYDPAADTWRPLAPLPAGMEGAPASVWTGTELVVLALGPRGVAYDPETDTWRELPPPPLPVDAWSVGVVWTGDEIIAVANPAQPANPVVGAALDPDEDEWRIIAEPPALSLNARAPTWIGTEMAVVSSTVQESPPAATTIFVSLYDPDGDEWRSAGFQEVHQEVGESIWTGTLLITGYDLQTGGQVAAYDPSADRWLRLPTAPPGERIRPVWTGSEVIWWGGREGGESIRHLADGAVYRPED